MARTKAQKEPQLLAAGSPIVTLDQTWWHQRGLTYRNTCLPRCRQLELENLTLILVCRHGSSPPGALADSHILIKTQLPYRVLPAAAQQECPSYAPNRLPR
jgi:hypothetical protein